MELLPGKPLLVGVKTLPRCELMPFLEEQYKKKKKEEEEASVQSQRITDVVAPSVSRCGKYFTSDLPRERATDRLARIQPALMGIYFVSRNTSFPYAVGR